MSFLPLPTFFEPANAERHEYAPDQQRLFVESAEWRRAHRIAPAAGDARKVHLLLIDEQKDFCFPRGSLYVGGRSGRGALEDNRRVSELIYKNLGVITSITATLDSHYAFQIFFPSFWVDHRGEALGPFREITLEEVERGALKPNPAIAGWLCDGNYPWLVEHAKFYCAELEKAGKYKLYLWPPHCILGSDGHALAGVVHEARMFHSFVRGAQSSIEIKGGNALTENYSVLRPEVLVRHDRLPLAARNTELISTLLEADAIVVAGQAASHCVKSSIDDLLDEIRLRDPRLAAKVYVVADCMSSVAVPDGKGGFLVDSTAQAEAAMARWAEAGMHIVRSTEPMIEWPGLRATL